ncbi:MAG: DUF4129 domain-containing protein [Chloroflexaceae bacterium]|nr:DUF4129 domain-containing protein [Chloroflexaceae bacterium]
MVVMVRCWLLVAALGGACLLAAPPPASAQTPPPDLQTYEHWLREAFAAAQRGDRLGLEQVTPDLVQTTRVRASESALLPVDNRWLRDAMDEPEPDLPLVARHLGAILDALAQPRPTTPDDAQERLAKILARPPFDIPDDSHENLVSQFFKGVFLLLERLLEPIFGNAGSGHANVIGWMAVILTVLLIVGVLVYLVLHIRRSLTREARTVATEGMDESFLTSAKAFQEARAVANRGDIRSAVRYLYLSSLLWLDERGLLRRDHALTNQEYLAQLPHADLRTRFQPIVETFDRVWYGHITLEDQDFRIYQQQVEELRQTRSHAVTSDE